MKSSYQVEQERIARRDRNNRILAWSILLLGAALIAFGVWALVTLLIGAFG
jgi:hypothetical protein